jgi:hypothetical protein
MFISRANLEYEATMKLVITAILICLVLGKMSAQTVYPVPADSKGNQIVLTVANESKTTAAQNLLVQLQKGTSAIAFTQSSASVKTIAVGKESAIAFRFDVIRDAKIGKNDTLLFLITDNTGASWAKSVVVSYVGPQVYKLEQNFPNPFNPSTTIYYDLPQDSHVKIMIYDILGREVRSLVDEQESAGYQKVRFDIQGVASGVYFYRIQAEPLNGGKTFSNVKKMMVLK